VEAWLSQLKRWIKRLFKSKKKRQTTKIIQSWNNKYCIVHQIERDVPGAVATYRINKLGELNYLITLDYLSQLQKDLELGSQLSYQYNTSFRVRDTSGRQGHRTLKQTHRFAVFRIWHNDKLDCINAWDVDLCGISARSSIQELAPRQAVKYVVLSVLGIFHDPNLPLSWQFQIEDIDWLFLLRNRIREELSNPRHNLHENEVFPAILT
jgi:hypothetical protein